MLAAALQQTACDGVDPPRGDPLGRPAVRPDVRPGVCQADRREAGRRSAARVPADHDRDRLPAQPGGAPDRPAGHQRADERPAAACGGAAAVRDHAATAGDARTWAAGRSPARVVGHPSGPRAARLGRRPWPVARSRGCSAEPVGGPTWRCWSCWSGPFSAAGPPSPPVRRCRRAWPRSVTGCWASASWRSRPGRRSSSAGPGAAAGQSRARRGDHPLPGRRLRRGVRRLRAGGRDQPDPGARRSGVRRGSAAGLAPAPPPRRRHPGGPTSAGGNCCGPRASSRRSGRGTPRWREPGGWPGCRPPGGSPAARTGSHPTPSPPPSGCWTGCRSCRPTIGCWSTGSRCRWRSSPPARFRSGPGWTAPAAGSPTPSGPECRSTSLIAADRLAAATSIVVTSVTGYRRRFPVGDADALWLATWLPGRTAHRRHRSPGSAGGAEPPRLLVGQVGGLGRAQRRPGVRPVALPAPVDPRPFAPFPRIRGSNICRKRRGKGAKTAAQLQPLVLPQPSQT